MRKILTCLMAGAVAVTSLGAYQTSSPLTPEVRATLDRISADSLKGHLSFIASDLLEGRNAPSRGLDLAAEYIAAQFRRAGLDPVGDDGYFQTANWLFSERNMNDFTLRLKSVKQTVNVTGNQVSFTLNQSLKLAHSELIKADFRNVTALEALGKARVSGKVVITEFPDLRGLAQADAAEGRRAQNEFLTKVSALKPSLVVSIDRNNPLGNNGGPGRLIDPENRPNAAAAPNAPLITIHAADAVKLFDALIAGPNTAMLSVNVPDAKERPVKLRNVIGLLRGSDPALKDTYVLVTAHYDHLGIREGMAGDNLFNGANDDGSGTVSVIEIAGALTNLNPRPKRSIVFMTVFGEEKGLLGSRYYGRHPIFPIDKTVGDVNIEQVGRTDSTEGAQINNASMTGFDFTDVGPIFQKAGELTGITVYKHATNSDSYFGRSDNQALADQGVPAHTLCVAFNYPDYHGAGDHWEKIDYANMAKVDRMVALGLVMIANNPEAPKWNEANPKTVRYVEAWKKQHSK